MIRGHMMRDAALANKDRAARQATLETDIETPDAAEYALQRLQGWHYEQGEKARRLLAAQLRQRPATLAIPAIKVQSGEFLTHPQDIVGEYVTFLTTAFIPQKEGRELLGGGDITRQEILQVLSRITSRLENMYSQRNSTSGRGRKRLMFCMGRWTKPVRLARWVRYPMLP
ncbi:hypothetical protein NDU88_003972 [Pleurodeles waltl]|uniref:Uncharacterized protein n=1 Tax=Pleurodeles waltl TaxID=8319 RepID=A0AAV7UHV1_PLEWA|nr:hypothetical protein NDU88_003972 [Pleurodeles waltl]